jgi:PBP1b-binding outer membrane lipoprotein LpoB
VIAKKGKMQSLQNIVHIKRASRLKLIYSCKSHAVSVFLHTMRQALINF